MSTATSASWPVFRVTFTKAKRPSSEWRRRAPPVSKAFRSHDFADEESFFMLSAGVRRYRRTPLARVTNQTLLFRELLLSSTARAPETRSPKFDTSHSTRSVCAAPGGGGVGLVVVLVLSCAAAGAAERMRTVRM
ncbi:MAG: hypothetical protein DMF86_01755, partial [Acidobacteria bacterium]